MRQHEQTGQRFERKHRASGFSLIEILVAIVILTVIVLVISTVFHQSNLAWDGGTRKAEGNMTARAVLGFMAREMAHAVTSADPLNNNITDGGSSIRFVTVAGELGSTQRVARRITYTHQPSVFTIVRKEEVMEWDPDWVDSDSWWYSVGGWDPLGESPLADNVQYLRFSTSTQSNHTDTLPAWIGIKLGMVREDDVSGLGAWSKGPKNGYGGTPDDPSDDIKSF